MLLTPVADVAAQLFARPVGVIPTEHCGSCTKVGKRAAIAATPGVDQAVAGVDIAIGSTHAATIEATVFLVCCTRSGRAAFP